MKSTSMDEHISRRDTMIGAASAAAVAAVTVPTLVTPTAGFAQDGQEPLGGQPPKGATASVQDFDYQIKYQRAFEAVLWNIPAIAIYSFRRAAFTDLGMKDNDIIAIRQLRRQKSKQLRPTAPRPTSPPIRTCGKGLLSWNCRSPDRMAVSTDRWSMHGS
jgi:hypothetical protein